MAQETYPPQKWVCPSCGKKHSKPHFAFPDQIDETKRPGQVGRMKFGREVKDESGGNYIGEKSDCKRPDMETGPKIIMTDCNQPINTPLTCVHCGWQDDITNIVKKC